MPDAETIRAIAELSAAVAIAVAALWTLFKVITMMHNSHKETIKSITANFTAKIDEISTADRDFQKRLAEQQTRQSDRMCDSMDALTKALNRGEDLIEKGNVRA